MKIVEEKLAIRDKKTGLFWNPHLSGNYGNIASAKLYDLTSWPFYLDKNEEMVKIRITKHYATVSKS